MKGGIRGGRRGLGLKKEKKMRGEINKSKLGKRRGQDGRNGEKEKDG